MKVAIALKAIETTTDRSYTELLFFNNYLDLAVFPDVNPVEVVCSVSQ